jgi:hypothetical protein
LFIGEVNRHYEKRAALKRNFLGLSNKYKPSDIKNESPPLKNGHDYHLEKRKKNVFAFGFL